MSEKIEEKLAHPKCADAIEFGYNFGNFSRIKNKQFALILDEKKSEEGFYYKYPQYLGEMVIWGHKTSKTLEHN